MTLTEARAVFACGILLAVAGMAWILGPYVLIVSGATLTVIALVADIKEEPGSAILADSPAAVRHKRG